MENTYIIISATFDNEEEAKMIADILLGERLVSCCQFSNIRSKYYWKGKLEETEEILLQMKSKKKLYKEVERVIIENHSYDVPQIVATNITCGSKDYLSWIDEETK